MPTIGKYIFGFIVIICFIAVFLLEGKPVIQQSGSHSIIESFLLFLVSIYFLLSYLFEKKSPVFQVGIFICTHLFWPGSKRWALVISLVTLVFSIKIALGF